MLFFVLSGYLITGILLCSHEDKSYFSHFYARRALRIFPAYFFILGLTAVFQVLFPSEDLAASANLKGTEWWYFIFYVQNYWMGLHNFDTPLSQVLGFTWTLAVEEQFYLIWPLVVWVISRRYLLLLCIALLLLAPLSRLLLLGTSGNPWLMLAAMSSHLDSLAAGALIAVLSQHERYRQFICARSGLLLIVISAVPLLVLISVTGMDRYASPSGWVVAPGNAWFLSLASLLFAGALILSLNASGLFARLLAARPLVALGRISYGLYIYHTLASALVFELANARGLISFTAGIDPGLWFALEAAGAALTLIVAPLSYRFLETPFLRLKRYFTHPTTDAVQRPAPRFPH